MKSIITSEKIEPCDAVLLQKTKKHPPFKNLLWLIVTIVLLKAIKHVAQIVGV